tara:strand:+ start:2078 stop:2893 length:816 start_codon:yes stop_codon:yes gene_type:complete
MSLEQTIADLVAASNNLTGTINTKMNEIDQKVDEAVKAIPELHKEIYVSAGSGNNSNTGTSGSPVQTIKEAIERIPENGSGEVFLAKGETFRFTESVGFVSKSITLRSTVQNSVSTDRPIIHLESYKDSGFDWSEAYGMRVSGSATIKLINVEVDTGELATDATSYRASPCGLIARNHFQGNTAFIDFSAYDSKFKMRGHPVMSLYGACRVSLSSVEREFIGAGVPFVSASVFSIYESTTTDSDETLTPAQIYDGLNTDGSNVITNINLTA